ncbi:phytanoyl-CoA dioxygenase family protein [Agriterribacter sp.]|uniref:phytanoyl-CoA dioxygenase family protein n=1 Tax=Agriterribacter sp. TaxID=2821509 RepID=UPI002C4FC091|nr:phytanoyl-CoA dioxygenase family protein [Agriterribacter sp.]HRO46675.1 phytanoyl-CoA dioxygenase family protein [Agriterribacter sp.]HRQ16985.1 phytanoyl-CoA dioxygenase family protein [Agriterribacter sp.]
MGTINNSLFHLGDTLTTEQKNFFHKFGILQFRNFIDKATVASFIEEISSVEQELLTEGIQKINGIPLKFGKNTDGRRFIQRIAFTSQHSNRLSVFLKDKRLAALVALLYPYEGRVGENEKDGLVLNHYINTPDSEYKQLGWHTDSPRDIFLGSRIMPMLNVGLHLDDYPFEKGGLRVLTGTHTQNLFRLLFRKKYFVDNDPDPREVGFNIEAGDLTVHDGRLWHRVQRSAYSGDESRRRVMYIPIVTGAYRPKHADSPTPFYHKLALPRLERYRESLRWPTVKEKGLKWSRLVSAKQPEKI